MLPGTVGTATLLVALVCSYNKHGYLNQAVNVFTCLCVCTQNVAAKRYPSQCQVPTAVARNVSP